MCRQRLRVSRGVDLPHLDQCWSAGAYSGWLRDSVLAYKSGRIENLPGLVAVLGRVLETAQLTPDSVVGIPSTASKVRSRGFDSVGELTAELAKQVKIPYKPILRYSRKVKEQVGLDRIARGNNLQSAFTSTQPVSGCVVLVDDVVTTGATVKAAAKTLRLCGAKKIFVISVCRT